MSLEIFDEGRQKANACHGGRSPACEDNDTEGGLGSEGPQDHKSTRGGSSMLKRAKYSPIGACPSIARGHAGHESCVRNDFSDSD